MTEQINIRIAIADDHEILVNGTVSLLEAMGFEVPVKARNGKELISHLEKATLIPDICILDIFMPVMNGLETIVILKKKWPDMRVLVLSMMDEPQYVTRMLMEGANGYLSKSTDAMQLKKAIETLYKNDVYFSELVTSQYWTAIKKGRVTLPYFTATETQILRYCCTDMTYKEISEETGHTEGSIQGHRENIFRKLGIHNRVGLLRFAIKNGIELVELPNVSGEAFYKR